MPRARIAALNVYPVKSCRGIGLADVRVAARGFVAATPSGDVGDREWMIVDRDGRFVTQREHPRLALIRRASPTARWCSRPRAARRSRCRSRDSAATTREVVVWNSVVPAHDAGDDAAAWLSSALGARRASRALRSRRIGGFAIPITPATRARTRRSPTAIRCSSSAKRRSTTSTRGSRPRARRRCR